MTNVKGACDADQRGLEALQWLELEAYSYLPSQKPSKQSIVVANPLRAMERFIDHYQRSGPKPLQQKHRFDFNHIIKG